MTSRFPGKYFFFLAPSLSHGCKKQALIFALLLATVAQPVCAQEELKTLATDLTEPVSADACSGEIERQIRREDRKIFLELVKLAEFNVSFQQTVNHYGRWRKILYPLAQEAGYACLFGYSLTDLGQRAKGWRDPSVISSTTSKRALTSATVGTLLGATSSVAEMIANGLETARAKRKGFSVAQSLNFVQGSVKRSEEMLARRHALMEKAVCTGTQRELLQLKEELLRYERDRLVFEFKRWSAHSRGYAWYKNSFYAINATVNLGRFSAAPLAFKSFTSPGCSGAIGPLLITSACLASLGPAASSAMGKCIERHQERLLIKKLPLSTPLTDAQVKAKFDRLAQLLDMSHSLDEPVNTHGILTSELIGLREEKLGLDNLIYHEERNIERTRKVAGQQAVTAPLISSLGAGSAILGTIGYYGYRQKPLITNKLALAGDTAVITAEGVALVATPAAAIRTYLYERNLKSKGEHPDQLFAKRLADLKALEKMVNEAWQ